MSLHVPQLSAEVGKVARDWHVVLVRTKQRVPELMAGQVLMQQSRVEVHQLADPKRPVGVPLE
eukprot:CAMPEP_0181204154 /NCGR_PEP_ID=MMETSP1096-20121128/19781_1 /TAXON_ID=156174 ORGANISM="Chrysochromulina ericina, Strain CCMP281" /NCGR_SAMPLE_ID=MMETSP1096 /ASSEMBLY_ACC=CAM_ASM_000453 /LENGTH=62 /DNA_ID=CAMNT_0023294829 /DNA_START=414 /DNA_END=602 /DNA_ORIENTATION=+